MPAPTTSHSPPRTAPAIATRLAAAWGRFTGGVAAPAAQSVADGAARAFVRLLPGASARIAAIVQDPGYQPGHGLPLRQGMRLGAVLLLHGWLLWMLLDSTILLPLKPAQAPGEAISYATPLAKTAAERPKVAARRQPKADRPAQPRPHVQPPRAITPPSPIPPPEVLRPASVPAPVPEEDMFATVQAARKRRADAGAQAQPGATPQAGEEDEAARALRAARANIAGAQAGNASDRSGGMFEITNKTSFKADFVFRGWSANSRRNATQFIHVELGDAPNIELAVVNRMIELIRTRKTDDFIWESHRLGRNVTLSARPEHTRELQQFILREFFPSHPPLAQR